MLARKNVPPLEDSLSFSSSAAWVAVDNTSPLSVVSSVFRGLGEGFGLGLGEGLGDGLGGGSGLGMGVGEGEGDGDGLAPIESGLGDGLGLGEGEGDGEAVAVTAIWTELDDSSERFPLSV
ncbi:MAG: hypothetical protein A3I52_03080 [Candidatus Blackburnbacteria bacterium RIFCSPLOWO2_02_FULL_40_10]|nr:MAG: hypothetical protein A3I52_03080 [Candidatus Blackburnbacteria bacterium RIFCSPLOWO2_02_FULL_40_10]